MKRVLCGLVVLTAAPATIATTTTTSTTTPAAPPASTGAPAAAIWQPLAPGAERGISNAADVRLDMFRFDLDRYDAEVLVGGRARPAHARIWMAGARHTAAEVLRHAGAGQVVAVVNGGFFDENGRSLGLRMIHGDAAVPFRGNVDWGVFAVAGRRARIVHSRDFVADRQIDAAIQVGPRILIDGVVPRLKPQVARRTAVALDREGKMLTLVVADAPVDATRLGEHLASLGFHAALLLDGGPSTQIAVGIGRPRAAAADAAGQIDIRGGYPVPDLLAIVRR